LDTAAHRSSALHGAAVLQTVTPGRGVAVSLSWSWSHQRLRAARERLCIPALRDTFAPCDISLPLLSNEHLAPQRRLGSLAVRASTDEQRTGYARDSGSR